MDQKDRKIQAKTRRNLNNKSLKQQSAIIIREEVRTYHISIILESNRILKLRSNLKKNLKSKIVK